MTRVCLGVLSVGILCVPLCAQPPEAGVLLGTLYLPRSGRSARASSSNPDWNSNRDFLSLEPAEEAEIADLKGPGIIQHIWLTIDCPDPYYPRHLTLRAWWDGEPEPSIEVPLGDFFAVGHGMDALVNSVPVQVSSNGRARNCYWPMPFRQSARLTVTNDGPAPVYALYYYVDWLQLEAPLPDNVRTFHAQYRQRYPRPEGEDYVLAEINGAGHYVGTVMSIYSAEVGWPGEGDDRFYIDGEQEPSIRGTGTEDYFSDAWGFRRFTSPFYGVPVWEGTGEQCRTTAYRWHILDPIVFSTSLKAAIENRGWAVREGQWDGHAQRPDRVASVAFWYQTEPHLPFPEFPAVDERLPFEETRYEIEDIIDTVRVPDGAPRPSVQPGREWAGNAQMFYGPQQMDHSRVEVPFQLEQDGRYVVVLRLTTSYDFGTSQIALDGEDLGPPQDLYTPGTEVEELRLGVFDLAAGEHTLSLRCVDRHPDSTGVYLGLDSLMLRK